MDKGESKTSRMSSGLSSIDPFGIRQIIVGDAHSLLHVEALIATRQWHSKNGSAGEANVDGKSNRKS